MKDVDKINKQYKKNDSSNNIIKMFFSDYEFDKEKEEIILLHKIEIFKLFPSDISFSNILKRSWGMVLNAKGMC